MALASFASSLACSFLKKEKEKDRLQALNTKERDKLKVDKLKIPKEKEIDYVGEDAFKRMHLFRGKNLNNQILDLATGEPRARTKKEKED